MSITTKAHRKRVSKAIGDFIRGGHDHTLRDIQTRLMEDGMSVGLGTIASELRRRKMRKAFVWRHIQEHE